MEMRPLVPAPKRVPSPDELATEIEELRAVVLSLAKQTGAAMRWETFGDLARRLGASS